ncbi:MAG: ribonuclease P protein component [Deltaproteobacteria bacterium]|nr:ribonuclease P protein component [Deltaproteobacteria bacterium]
MGATFKKRHRLTKRAEFVRLTRLGTRCDSTHFFSVMLPGTGPDSRLGVTVTRRVGCAVVRTRIKRLVREHFRLNRQVFKSPYDINVIAKNGAKLADNGALFSSLEALFSRVEKLASS